MAEGIEYAAHCRLPGLELQAAVNELCELLLGGLGSGTHCLAFEFTAFSGEVAMTACRSTRPGDQIEHAEECRDTDE